MDNNIKKLRQEYKPKLTQEALAKKIGVTKLTISRWENNERTPKADKAQELADIFNVSVGYLLGSTDIRRKYDDEKILDFSDLPIDNKYHSSKIASISSKRSLDESFDKFVDYLDDSNFLLSDDQIKSVFNLLIEMSDSLNLMMNTLSLEKADILFNDMIDNGGFDLLFPKD